MFGCKDELVLKVLRTYRPFGLQRLFEGQMRRNTLIESFDKSCKKFFWMRQIYIHTYVHEKFIHRFHGQNTYLKNYNFGPKNDGEK